MPNSNRTEEEWKALLTPEQYKALRQKGTEPPFTGEYVDTTDQGMYHCAACGAELFRSDHKFSSKEPGLAGWPSFYDVAKSGAVELEDDSSFGMQRIEVKCANCGSHLGHVFPDANDQPEGQHYCINSVCLDFKPNQDANT